MRLSDLQQRPVDETLLYCEQHINYLFQSFTRDARQSEVSTLYQPEKGVEYTMPYVWLDRTNANVEWFESQPDPHLLSVVRYGEWMKFFVHPEMIEDYKARNLTELLDFSGTHTVAPTASTRTVLIRDIPDPVMVKTNMTKRVGFVRRKMRRSAVSQSSQIMGEMAEIATVAPPSLAYLPESIGVAYKEDIGMLLRECQARPHVDAPRPLVPFFSLISLDARRPNDPLLLCQLVEQHPCDPFQTFVETLLIPLLEAWAFLVLDRGLLPIPHAQNLLLELDPHDGTSVRVVFRDLQDIAIDGEVRRQQGLHCHFSRHFIDDIEHLPLQVGTERVRDVRTARQIYYSLQWDFWLGTLLRGWTVVLSKYPSCSEAKIVHIAKDFFRERVHPRAGDLFPAEQFAVDRIDDTQRVRLVQSRGAPIYR